MYTAFWIDQITTGLKNNKLLELDILKIDQNHLSLHLFAVYQQLLYEYFINAH